MTLQTFMNSYMEAVDFTKADTGDETTYDLCSGFSDAFLVKMRHDCALFFVVNEKYFGEATHERAGHDFWLTRQGHGAEFSARPEIYGADNAALLSNAADKAGQIEPYIGDDNLIYA